MKLFDPQRPTSDGIPLWSPAGHAASRHFGLPLIYVEPGTSEGSWRLTIHMPTSANAFAGFEASVASTAELTQVFERWLADPEEVIERTFKYSYDAVALKRSTRPRRIEREAATGLAELGLLD